ncbi:MAG: hypothetical protein A3D31_08155 [Candidatus Fluviicola riflensis]|nr:MAG: hypothetical protein CHH17_06850 [Candidatus Fluviicola riflensis]OGS79913.1 MAG: hypothetical protein A3D31_08155 [Candidatus Fluviicola riflensis]OGS82428.1 MAG: hypothetical protein A2724_17100 [Fluviicola sp. RIFCSPHIGHO2_01_FULL_43_53]OGS88092.1 MAG: hypothetical protein A3E30_14535 [Fluviicola sp. RIFCSPHIGHO2_12_FULL_43_24]
MSRNINQQESMRIAAERMRLKKEREAREEKEFYERITSGTPWLLFKTVVVFCTLMALITTFEIFVDGPTKKLSENDWKIDRDWEWTWHTILDVEGYMFTPELRDWSGHMENTLEMTYSPVFRTGKKLSYDIEVNESTIRRHEEIRQSSIFTWFPAFQLFLLIPLITFIFKRQSAWFNFARIASFVFVLPGTLLVMYWTLL